MKKILSILAFIVVGVLSANASEFYVFFTKDFTKEYYKNSCLSCTPKVKITNVDPNSKSKSRNTDGGVIIGAEFNITQFDDSDKRKIHFKDNVGDRYDVEPAGVEFETIIYVNDNKDTVAFDPKIMKIIPAYRVAERENEMKSDVIYNERKGTLNFKSDLKGKYMLLKENEKPYKRPLSISGNNINVEKDDRSIYLILSDADEGEGNYIRDINIPLSELRVKETWWEQHYNQVLWSVLAIFVVLVLFILAMLIYRKNKRTSSREKNNAPTEIADNDRDADSDLHTTIKGYYKTLMEDSNIIKEKLDNIESLVSNTEDKQKILQLTKTKDDLSSKINVKIKEIGDLKETIIRKDKEITDLKVEINKIKNASVIVDAERLSGYEHFLSFAKHILVSCAKAEQLCYSFDKSHPAEEQLRLEGYFCEYLMSKPTIQILDWNSILSTLDLNGYIKAPQFAVYIKSKTDKEKIDFLYKLFFENVVRPYVSSVLVLLEQLRASEIVGVVNSVKHEFDVTINELLTLCKGEGVVVDFHKLLEPISSYELVEIADNIIPLSVERNIKKDQHDVLLFVQKYAVNSPVSDTKEKTICYMIL